ncbi:cytochrome p450 [Rhyzopertha dominica]|nr:cytochrome p450 [Rhyzopertha dominica]
MWIEIILFAAILFLFAFLDAKKPKNYPPGPKWLPIIGSMVHVAQERKKHKHLFTATSVMSEDRGLVGLRLGKELLVVVTGAKVLKEFHTNDDLAGRPTGPFYEDRTWGRKYGVMLTDSDLWREQRRFVMRQLKEFGFGRHDMSAMIEEETGKMVDHIKKQLKESDKPIELDMGKVFSIHVLNTLWTILAGIRYNAEDRELKKLQGLLNELFVQTHMVGALFHYLPFMKFLAPNMSGYNLYLQTHKPIWEFIFAELDNHKKTFNSKEPRDFMDVYLKMLKDPERPKTFNEKQLVAICMDLFMAGSETTSKSLAFGFLYMLRNPEIQKKAQEEIDSVVGRDRQPTLDDRAKMPYVEAVVLESLRMFMGRAFGVPHRALKDTTLAGYFIPKDTTVVANYYDIFIGKDFMDSDPEEFRPERYLKDGRIGPMPDMYIPFGLGKHRCMGEALARANVFLFIATLLQNFTFLPSKQRPPDLEFIDGITPGPKPYNAVVKLRERP